MAKYTTIQQTCEIESQLNFLILSE